MSRTDRESSSAPRALVYLLLLEFGAGGALYPFFALYLRQIGFSKPQIALTFLAGAGASVLSPFLWGWIGDRVLALNFLVPLLHLAASAVLFQMTRLEGFLLVLLAFTVYSGLRVPCFSLVNALCYHNLADPPGQFGRLRLWGSVGWMLPVAPIYLWHRAAETSDMTVSIYLAIALELAIVLSAPVLPHTPPPARRAERGSTHYLRDLRRLFSTRGFVHLLAINYLMSSAFSIMFSYSNLRLEEVGVPRQLIGPALALGVLLELPLFFALKAIIRRLGFPTTLALGAAACLVRQLTFSVGSHGVTLVCASLLIAPAVVFFLVTSSLAVDSLAAREVRATAQSTVTLVGSGLGTLSGLLATYYLTEYLDEGMWLPFLIAATTSAAGLALIPWLRKAFGRG